MFDCLDISGPWIPGQAANDEQMPPPGSDANANFRDQYIYMLPTIRTLDSKRIQRRPSREEWSCYGNEIGVIPGVLVEMDSNNRNESGSQILPFELPAYQEI